MSEHTPGPWKVADHSGPHRSFISSNDECTLPIKNDGIFIAHALGPDNKANARLIAAAPEMKSAGDKLAEAASDVHPTAPSAASITRLVQAIDAWWLVKNRAEGRDP